MHNKGFTFLSILIFILLYSSHVYADDNKSIFDLTLRELLNIKVSTASREEESIDETPAFVEIISQDDIQRRGYKDLSYILEDIAGIQMTRAYGDSNFNTVWRGQRYTVGSSFLILVDGVKFNHLYYNEAEIMAAFPLSNIKYVEIVHGAASVAYGNDAISGIINIITKTEFDNSSLMLEIGENNQQVIDFTYSKKISDYQINITGRYDQGDVDFSKVKHYQWTDPALLRNKNIWGDFANEYGDLESPHYNRALSAKLYNKNSELSAQYYQLSTGYGLIYTFDHTLPNSGLWAEPEYSLHYKRKFQLQENLSIDTIVRYRQSNVNNDSLFIESYLSQDNEQNIIRLTDASYWQSKNSSRYAAANINWKISNKWSLVAGSELEFKSLQKAYNINFGASLPPAEITENYHLPLPPTKDSVNNNRKKTSQKNIYLLSRYSLPKLKQLKAHNLHLGIRRDQHSVFGTKTTVRAGWVGQLEQSTIKFFYSEAYQEPSARLLYGGWKGSGSDPSLKPRNTNTWEFNANYQWPNVIASINLYRLNSSNLFNTTEVGAINIGKAKTDGATVRLQYQQPLTYFKNLALWSAYNWQQSKEQTANNNAKLTWQHNIDSANNTLHFGAYLDINEHWQINLRGRYIGDRATVKTNELRKIKAYTTLDANISYQFNNKTKTKVSLAITNLFDTTYFHPGVRSASAVHTGFTGTNEQGVFIGSQSFYNAKIAQPGRELKLSVYWQW